MDDILYLYWKTVTNFKIATSFKTHLFRKGITEWFCTFTDADRENVSSYPQ